MAAEPMVWVIRVTPIEGPSKDYAVIADNQAHAEALVGDHCNVTNEKVEFVKVLHPSHADRLGLKAGDVKPYE